MAPGQRNESFHSDNRATSAEETRKQWMRVGLGLVTGNFGSARVQPRYEALLEGATLLVCSSATGSGSGDLQNAGPHDYGRKLGLHSAELEVTESQMRPSAIGAALGPVLLRLSGQRRRRVSCRTLEVSGVSFAGARRRRQARALSRETQARARQAPTEASWQMNVPAGLILMGR